MALTAPTPPTPPTIDKGDVQTPTPRIDAHQFFEVPEMPFHAGNARTENVEEPPKIDEKVSTDENSAANRQVTTPEDMARDAVANGSGALTKRTVTRADDSNGSTNSNPNANPISNANTNANTISNSPTSNSNVANVPAAVQMPPNTNSENYERGQAVLREFRDEDRRLEENSPENSTTTATTANFHNSDFYQENHGGIFWILTLIFVVTATFLVAKKFLFRRKPALKKSDLFVNSSEKLKSTAEKFSTQPKTAKPIKKSAPKFEPPKTAEKVPPVKPAKLPKKDDDDKGKHFEIRV